MLKSAFAATALAACALALQPAPAHAQSGGWAVVVGAATDNRSKDASKSAGDPYVFGVAEWSSDNDTVYVGPKFETIRSSTGARLELELNAGYRPEIAGFSVDLNIAHKWQVDADRGQDDDAFELTADVSRAIGPVEAGVQWQHSPNGTGGVRAWTWVAASVGLDVTDRLNASVALGRREQDGAPDYAGWNAGVTYAASSSVELELRYHDTDADPSNPQYASALVASVSVYF